MLSARSILFLLLCSALAALPAPAQSAPQQMQELFQQAAARMQAGDAAGAEELFRRATQLDPSFAPAWLDLGIVQLRQSKLVDAIPSIHKALALDPNARGANLFLGIAEYESSHADAAVDALHRAIEQDPKNVQALTWLGIVELNIRHPEKATEPLDRAAEIAPTDENVLDYRVQAHMAVAKQSYDQLFRVDPTSWRLHRLNAVIDAQAQDHNQAIGEYQLAIKLAPKQPELYEGLGWEYRAVGHADRAVTAFEKQLQLTPNNPIAMFNLGSSQVESGQPAAAIPLLEKVVSIYRVPSAADYYLGRALNAEGKYTEAAHAFERSSTLSGELHLQSWYQLAQVYRHLGRTADADQAVAKYKELRSASEAANAREMEDWRKLNAATAAASSKTPSQ